MIKQTAAVTTMVMCVVAGSVFAQDWGSGVAAPEPGRLSLTAGFERLSQSFHIAGLGERLRRDLFQARADYRTGDVLSFYGFIGTADFSGHEDSLRALAYGGGLRLLFLGEVIVEEKDRRPLEVKLGAALDFRATRFQPEKADRNGAGGLSQFQAGLDLGLSVMGIGGYLGFYFTRNLGELPYLAVHSAVPASKLNFSMALGLHNKISRHLGLAVEWSFFGLRSWGIGLRIYP